MGETINLNSSNGPCANDSSEIIRTENDLIEITDGILLDARTDISTKNTIRVYAGVCFAHKLALYNRTKIQSPAYS